MPYVRRKRRRKRRKLNTEDIKLYSAILLVSILSAVALNFIIDWGSGVMKKVDMIAGLELDPESMEKLKEMLKGEIGDPDTLEKAGAAYNRMNRGRGVQSANWDRIGKIDPSQIDKMKTDMEGLKKAYKKMQGKNL